VHSKEKRKEPVAASLTNKPLANWVFVPAKAQSNFLFRCYRNPYPAVTLPQEVHGLCAGGDGREFGGDNKAFPSHPCRKCR
jgi:hypothetical protein